VNAAKFNGKHAIVTGGGSGVGACIALQLATAGALVTIAGRREAPLAETAALHDNISPVCADVTSEAEVESMVSQARESHGSVHMVIANAGAAHSVSFAKMTSTEFRQMQDVNVNGVFNVYKAVLPDMLSNRWGRLVAIASLAGLKGYGYVAHYCAAKHAVVGLTRSIAIELATKGVTANAVCPSFVDTPMTDRSVANIMQKTGKTQAESVAALVDGNPLGRLIQPEEVADTVVWLCGGSASAVNGQSIAVSGGET